MSNRRRMTSYRPWGSLEDGTIEFESLTAETLEGALTVIREAFFTDESVSVAVDLLSETGAPEELEELCRDAMRDGVSVVAIDVTTGEVVAASFNKIQTRTEPPAKGYFERFSERCKCKASKALIDYMIDVDSRVDMFAHFNADCILEMMFLATKRSHRKRRIAELLVAASVEIGRQLNQGKNVKTPVQINGDTGLANADAIPSLISMLATSNYTKKIGDRAGFDTLAEVSYDYFTFAGKKFSERIGDTHRFSWLMAKRLADRRTRTISSSLI